MTSVEGHKDQKILVFLGGGCSLETEPLATIAGHYYKIPTVKLNFLIEPLLLEYCHALTLNMY